MTRLNLRYLSPLRIDRTQDGAATLVLHNPFAICKPEPQDVVKPTPFRAPSMHIDLDRRLNSKLAAFEELKTQAEDASNSLDERVRIIRKKRDDLNNGMGMLPSDLPEEFQKAVNSAVESARETLSKEAQEISEDADKARKTTDNTLYEIRKELEQLDRRVHTFGILVSIPIIGALLEKRYQVLSNKNEQLHSISDETKCFYERLLCSKSLIAGF